MGSAELKEKMYDNGAAEYLTWTWQDLLTVGGERRRIRWERIRWAKNSLLMEEPRLVHFGSDYLSLLILASVLHLLSNYQ